MENDKKQDCSGSGCCQKWMKNKFLVAFLVSVVIVVIFSAGFCTGARAGYHRSKGLYGRRGMMYGNQWGYGPGMMRGYGGFQPGVGYGQVVPQDQSEPSASPSTSPTTVTPEKQ